MIAELRNRRAKAIADARAFLDRARKENRDMNSEEQAGYDAAFAEGERLKVQIAREESLLAAEAELREPANPVARTNTPGGMPGNHGALPYTFQFRGHTLTFAAGTPEHQRHQPEARGAFQTYLRNGNPTLYQQIMGPHAALRTDSAEDGGYLTAPEEMVAGLLKTVDDAVWVRQKARRFTTRAQSIGVVKRTAKASTFAWGQELTTPTPDSSLKFGKRAHTPHYMTGEVVLSRDLLGSAIMNVEEIVAAEMARDAGELEEQAFLTGDGVQKPLGLFTASSDGISIARDTAGANTTTAFKADTLRDAKYLLKPQYRSRAEWLYHRDVIKNISKLTDDNKQYLWQPGLTLSDPDRLLGLPVNESEWAPSTMTAGLYVGMLADFSNYWIVDGLDLGVQRLNELLARANQVSILVRRKVDGAPQLEEGFVRIKMAAG